MAVLRSDNFTRADSSASLGTPSDSGSAWSALAVPGGTSYGIISNAAYSSGAASQALAVLDAGSADVDVQCTLTTLGSDSGLCGRATDYLNNLVVAVNGGLVKLYKCVAGAYTQLGSTYSGGVANGDVYVLRMSGTSITVFRNGSSIITATGVTEGQTVTTHGLRTNLDSTARFNSFSISSLAAAASAKRKLLLGVGA